jgi:adenylate kinase
MATRSGILLLGSSGAGKGTQARLLEIALGMHHLDFGNARRTAVETKTAVGLRLAALGDLVSRGSFFGDNEAADIFEEALQLAGGSSCFVLDGFPRNLEQLRRLRRQNQIDLGAAVLLEAPFETLLERIDGRLAHPSSGRTYHPMLLPPAVPFRDDITGEPLQPRYLSSEMSAAEALAARCKLEVRTSDPSPTHNQNHFCRSTCTLLQRCHYQANK